MRQLTLTKNNSLFRPLQRPHTIILNTTTMTEHPSKRRKTASDDSEPVQTQQKTLLNPSPLYDSNIPTSTSSSALPSAKYTRSDLVTLEVGSDERELVVCGQLLVKTSEFFEPRL